MRMCSVSTRACVPFYMQLGRVERQVEILSDSHGDIESIMRAICTYIPTSVPTFTFNRRERACTHARMHARARPHMSLTFSSPCASYSHHETALPLGDWTPVAPWNRVIPIRAFKCGRWFCRTHPASGPHLIPPCFLSLVPFTHAGCSDPNL